MTKKSDKPQYTDCDRGFEFEILEGNPRLLAWLTNGAGRATCLYEVVSFDSNVAPPNVLLAVGNIESPGDVIPIFDVLVGDDQKTRILRTDSNRGDFGSLGWAVKNLLHPDGRTFLTTKEQRIAVEAILAFDVRKWQPPVAPSEPYTLPCTFVVTQMDGRLSPAWDAMEFLYSKVAWAKGYTYRKTYEINISLERVIQLDAAAHTILAGAGDWLDAQKPLLQKLLTGRLKLLPKLEDEISRLVKQYGADRVQEALNETD